tara:strand:+ start:2421 stop:2957 length:537 start_codon:yes stop_codon:yes gene_type:complete
MKKITRRILPILLIILLMNISLSYAADDSLVASISNPKMVLYKNITEGEILNFQDSVIVNNENTKNIKITVTASGVWQELVTIREPSFTLKPDERKEVFYDIEINEPGEYGGDILVLFEQPDSKNELSLAQRLVVHVEGGGRDDSLTKISTTQILSLGGIVLFAILAISLFVLIRRGK